MTGSLENAHGIAMLGAGFIGGFYTATLHSQRRQDRVRVVYSRTEESARRHAEQYGVSRTTTDLREAVEDADSDVVVIALPNHLHEEAVVAAAEAGKAVLCTKPLGRTAAEARRMLDAVERAGVFHGYLEDLVYTPKTLHALQSVRAGALGEILWVRSRETHPGPHSAWFWDKELAGGGAIIDMGCHCIEIARSFVGKELRPLEVMCWADTQVHPIEAEDHGIGWIRFANGALGQFEVSWNFRGGMDLRDEVSGTEGTLWLNHFLRTGYEMYTSGEAGGYVAEKAEQESGWLFPVGDEVHELGYAHMFTDMFEALDSGREPTETFYDGYVVNAIIDAAYRSAESKRWQDVELEEWRGATEVVKIRPTEREHAGRILIKHERMSDGSIKRILLDKATGRVSEELERAKAP